VAITSNAIQLRELVGLRAAVVSDLYDPTFFEWLVLDDGERRARIPWVGRHLEALQRSARISSALLCANDRQRDLLLGTLLPTLDAHTLASTNLRSLEDRVLVVPNAVSRREVLPDRAASRQRLGLAPSDVVLLWGGGVWNWMDAETVVRAAEEAAAVDRRIRLVFLGLRRDGVLDPHASAAEPLLREYVGADPATSPVVVNDNWVAPDRRLDYLAAADAGVLGQYDTLETRFSFRTRLVDCLQADLPVITMAGDELSDRAGREGWGLVSPTGDVAAMRDHMLELATQAALRESLGRAARAAADAMTWLGSCAPLLAAMERMTPPSHAERAARARALLPDIARSSARQFRARVSRREV
jgi:glycosyltransferase involved in cell wall biosynthesis